MMRRFLTPFFSPRSSNSCSVLRSSSHLVRDRVRVRVRVGVGVRVRVRVRVRVMVGEGSVLESSSHRATTKDPLRWKPKWSSRSSCGNIWLPAQQYLAPRCGNKASWLRPCQRALRRPLSAPDRAPGCPEPRPASANQPAGAALAEHPGLFSTQLGTHGAGLVVESGVDDARVALGGTLRHIVRRLEHEHRRVRLGELPADRSQGVSPQAGKSQVGGRWARRSHTLRTYDLTCEVCLAMAAPMQPAPTMITS